MDDSELPDIDPYPAKRHSGLGVASFVIAIASGLFEFGLIAIAGFMEASEPGGLDENSPAAALLGLALFAGLFFDLLAIGLGIGGLCQRGRSKFLVALGVAIGIAVFLTILLVLVVGLVAG